MKDLEMAKARIVRAFTIVFSLLAAYKAAPTASSDDD